MPVPVILPAVGIALVVGAAVGAVFSLAYTIPKHKDGKDPEKLSQPERTHTAWGEKRWGKH